MLVCFVHGKPFQSCLIFAGKALRVITFSATRALYLTKVYFTVVNLSVTVGHSCHNKINFKLCFCIWDQINDILLLLFVS